MGGSGGCADSCSFCCLWWVVGIVVGDGGWCWRNVFANGGFSVVIEGL